MAVCERCGTSFDYKKNDGVCPKCRYYNKTPQVSKQVGKSRISKGIVIVVCIILCFGKYWFAEKEHEMTFDFPWEAEKDAKEAEVTYHEVSMEDARQGFTVGNHKFRIGDYKIIEAANNLKMIPKGEKIVLLEIFADDFVYSSEAPFLSEDYGYRRSLKYEEYGGYSNFVKLLKEEFPDKAITSNNSLYDEGYKVFFIDENTENISICFPIREGDEEKDNHSISRNIKEISYVTLAQGQVRFEESIKQTQTSENKTAVRILDVSVTPVDSYSYYESNQEEQIYKVMIHLKNKYKDNPTMEFMTINLDGSEFSGRELDPVDLHDEPVHTEIIPRGLDGYMVKYISLPKTEEKLRIYNYEVANLANPDITEYEIADILREETE